VSFYVDNTLPLTYLDVFNGEVLGTNSSYSVIRTQVHSVIPSGAFELTYGNTSITMPYDASPFTFQSMLQAIDDSILVDVSRGGSAFSGYRWTVTFTTPVGDLPIMRINASSVIGDKVVGISGVVTTLRNGSSTSLFFSPIPVWMTEVTLASSTSYATKSNVEVYVKTTAGTKLKAVCDGTGDSDSTFTGRFKGSETSCAYAMTVGATALVTNYTLAAVDADTTRVEIFGRNFSMLYAAERAPTVTVTIAGVDCNVTQHTDEHISCLVLSIPWGSYFPVVALEGFGDALITVPTPLKFKQSIYSISPLEGSFAGGQIVRIHGRGLRSDANVTLDGVNDP